MLTPSHGLLAWLFGRWALKSQPEMVKFLVLGSLFSDAPMTLYVVIEAMKGHRVWEIGKFQGIYKYIFATDWVRYSSAVLHSFVVVTLVLLLIPQSKFPSSFNEKTKAWIWGWSIFHLAVDFITHNIYGHQHLWPLSDYIFLSPLSSLNIYFLSFDVALSALAILILIRSGARFFIRLRRRPWA